MTDLTRTFAALSDPTRFDLVDKMLRRGELSAGTLAQEATISGPAVSRHLKVLREAGVIQQRIEGTHRYYSANPDTLQTINAWTMDHRSFWSASLDRLDNLLAMDPEGDET